MQKASAVTQSSNFNLKREFVDLVPARRSERVFRTVEDLEAMRTERTSVPASKHGLETITGASCETGAQ
ncbi:MAG: hypothetical protein M3340_13870 [Actinomycetota bacterium]|nr:hypothetical protein [Actinomycetota bacterium]